MDLKQEIKLSDLFGRKSGGGGGERVALKVDVDAEAGDAGDGVGEVDLAVDLEPLLLLGREHAIEKVARLLGSEGLELLQRRQPAAHAQQRRRPRSDVEVGGVLGGNALEKRVDGERLRRHASELSAGDVARFRDAAGNHSSEGEALAGAGNTSPSAGDAEGEANHSEGGTSLCGRCRYTAGLGYPSYKGDCMHTLRQRLNARDESGFTLIELLVVLIIIGVLLAIAIPSYLGFQKKAQQTAAMSDVRAAIPDAEAWYSDNNNYTGMSAALLKSTYDSGLVISSAGSTGIVTADNNNDATGQAYCISAVSGGHWAHVVGPGGQVVNDTSASADPCP